MHFCRFRRKRYFSYRASKTSSKRRYSPKAEKFFFAWKFFSRPLHMKELNLLFPTIPNFSGFIWEKSWNNRFEKCRCNLGENKGKNFFIEILRHQVVEYRRTRYVFRLNRACIFQPDGFEPRLNCLTSWLIWFFTMNHGNKFFLRVN